MVAYTEQELISKPMHFSGFQNLLNTDSASLAHLKAKAVHGLGINSTKE